MSFSAHPIDQEDVESIILGYSASTIGIGDRNELGIPNLRPSDFGNQAKEKIKQYSNTSVLSLTSKSAPSKPPVVLDKWYLQPVRGSKAIKVCGTNVSDRKTLKSSAIQIRVNARSVLSIKGTMYQLVGPVQHVKNMPVWFEEKFFNGFPSLWKSHMDDYLDWLSERSSDVDSDNDIFAASTDTPRLKNINIKLDLYRWVLHVCGKHVLVEGFALGPGDSPHLYRTSPVLDVIDDNVIYTTTRSYYRLSGALNLEATVKGGVSLWFAKHFKKGFPKNWRELLDVYLNYISTQENNSQDSKSNAVEMMSLLSCEGFALQSGNWQGKTLLLSDENDLENSADESLKSEEISFSHEVVEKRKITKVSKKNKSSRKNSIASKNKDKIKAAENKSAIARGKLRKRKVKVESSMQNSPFSKKSNSHEDFDKQQRCFKRIDQNILNNKRNRKKPLKAKPTCKESTNPHQTPDEKAVQMPEQLEVPAFCSPAPGHGLYRTRSGRHVFPPLQHWTYQRLSIECDAEGNETVIFHPGTKSVLKDSSSACEHLRKSEWIHRQFQQDQLLNIPSPNRTKVLNVKRKQKRSNCVKNLLGENVQSGSTTPMHDVLSDTLQCTRLNSDMDGPNDLKIQEGTIVDNSSDPFEKTSADLETQTLQTSSNSEIEDTIVQVGNSMKECKSSSQSNISKSDNKSAQTELSTTKPDKSSSNDPDLSDFLGISPNNSLNEDKSDTKQRNLSNEITSTNYPKPTNQQTISQASESPSMVVNIRYNLRRRKNRNPQMAIGKKDGVCSVEDSKLCNVNPVVTITKIDMSILKKFKCSLKSNSDDFVPPANLKQSSTIEKCPTGSDVSQAKKTRQKLLKNSKILRNKSADIGKAKGQRCEEHPEFCTALLPTQGQSKKSLKRKKKDKLPVDNNGTSVNDGLKPVDAAGEVKKSCAESNKTTKKSLSITAKRGTLKRRKQTKEVINVLSQPKNDQDFFASTSEPGNNFSFQSDYFKHNPNRSYLTPFTPVGKLPSDFDQYIKTPAWFQTPSSSDAFSCSVTTPAHLKLELGTSGPNQFAEIADKCIVQMQKKNRKKKVPGIRSKTVQSKKKKMVIPDNLFHVEADNPRNSSDDDDYFSS